MPLATSLDAPPADAALPFPVAVGRLVLLGHPVAHSLSPRFQNAALTAAGIPLRYEALDVPPAELTTTLDALIAARAAGNVTIPHKEAVAARCDLLTPLARRIGAVNTFWCTLDGRLCGDNTDAPGFASAAAMLLGGPASADLHVALLGAGGSASAVLAAVERWPGVRVGLWSRSPARATALAARFGAVARPVPELDEAIASADLVVNATPLGLRDDDPLPAPIALLRPHAAVLDLVYRPGETAWVRAARAAGHPAADGLTMLVEQGVAAFARWFDLPADRDVVWAAVGGRPGAR